MGDLCGREEACLHAGAVLNARAAWGRRRGTGLRVQSRVRRGAFICAVRPRRRSAAQGHGKEGGRTGRGMRTACGGVPEAMRRGEQSAGAGAREQSAGAVQSRAEQNGAEQSRTVQSGAAQSGAEQNRMVQSGAERSGAEQNGAEQSRTVQSVVEQRSAEQCSAG